MKRKKCEQLKNESTKTIKVMSFRRKKLLQNDGGVFPIQFPLKFHNRFIECN